MGRMPNLPAEQIKGYLSDAAKHFEIYTQSDTVDSQMPAIERAIEAIKSQLT